ncbi:hypothetical protein F1D05_37205 [Kribbella qitaiheensis]|uniref:Uncharacterized protein n=1 Tax=Kribbella qitaiheensis TaxID=1544730 RepID=A0A7G6X8E8_9ACTN|nr:hypothetical protein F1D05_37205 [Kribbella qitaiheensis]
MSTATAGECSTGAQRRRIGGAIGRGTPGPGLASPRPASPRPASPRPASPRPASPRPASPRPARTRVGQRPDRGAGGCLSLCDSCR